MGSDGLKAVTLNLNGGAFKGSSDSIKVVCAGGSFKAPSATGLTRPSGDNGTGFHWKGSDNKAYAVGDSVPNSVTTLTVQWVEAPAKEGQVWDGTSALYFDGGSGTEADPYQIRTAEQLCLLSAVINQMNYSKAGSPATFGSGDRVVIEGGTAQPYATFQKAHYKLTADIVLNDTKNWRTWYKNATGLFKWNPIGTSMNQFAGTFDGDNHTISGMYFNNTFNSFWNGITGGNAVGLFGWISGGNAVIKNVTVSQSYIQGYDSVGALVGYLYGLTSVTNCKNTGMVRGYTKVGGIAGYSTYSPNGNGTFDSCENIGEINGNIKVGGIVGEVSGTVKNCNSIKGSVPFATGDIGKYAQSNYYYIGYIIGQGLEGTGNSSEAIENGVTIIPYDAIVAPGKEKVFTATMIDASASTFTWELVNGDDYASIDSSGKLAVKNGAQNQTRYIIKAVCYISVVQKHHKCK